MYKNLLAIAITLLLVVPLVAGEYSLRQVIDLAYENGDSIRMKQLEMEQFRQKMNETRTGMLPSLDLQASFTLMSDPPEGIKIEKGSMGFSPSNQSQMPVPFPDRDFVLLDDTEHTYFKITTTLTQPIFTWGKLENAVKMSEIDYFVSGLSIQKAKEELKTQVSTIYFALVLARDAITLMDKSREVMRLIMLEKENSFGEGLINRQEVLEARKNLVQMQAIVIKNMQGYESGIESLRFITGIEDETIELVTPFRKTLPEMDEELLNVSAAGHSTDLDILKQQHRQARGLVDIEKGGGLFKPDISLVASFEITGQEIPFIGGNWTDTWNHNFMLTLGTRMKIGDSGKSHAKIKGAESMLKMASYGIQQMEKGLALQVRRGIEKVNTGYYGVLEKEASLDLVNEQYKNARISYENELITRGEEQGVQVLMYRSEMEYLSALFDFETALIELERLTGMEFE